jgi:hypothetical protein
MALITVAAGCNNTPDTERQDLSTGNIKPGAVVVARAPTPTVPTETPLPAPGAGSAAELPAGSTGSSASGSATPTTTAAAIPKECADYKLLIDKLSSCTKMQEEVRTALRASYIKDADNWGATDAAAVAAQASGCTQRAQQVKDVATKLCGW